MTVFVALLAVLVAICLAWILYQFVAPWLEDRRERRKLDPALEERDAAWHAKPLGNMTFLGPVPPPLENDDEAPT